MRQKTHTRAGIGKDHGYHSAPVRRYHVTTFGCQMNAHDSERIKGMLEELGLGEAPTQEDADVLVFNTCTIREKPDTKFAAHLAQAAALKQHDPDKVIAVGGCYAEAQRERLFELYPYVDVAFGPGSIPHLGEWLGAGGLRRRARGSFGLDDRALRRRAADAPRARVPGVGADLDGLQLEVRVLHRPGGARPRGEPPSGRRHRRGDAARARGRARGHAARPERQLVGPRPACRRSTPSSASCCAPATRSTGSTRIRFTSPHPKDFRRPVIDAMAECDAVCEHAHLPLQSGSSRILKAMRRTYDRERYLRLVDELRAAIPDLALTTDIIVGFPGETEEDFRETIEVVEEVGFDGAFTFVYSPRAGTEAAAMADQIPDDVKRDRIERLIDVVQRVAAARNAERVGGVEEVLVEGHEPHRSVAASRAARAATRPSTSPARRRPGELVDVRIDAATSTTLRGVQARRRSPPDARPHHRLERPDRHEPRAAPAARRATRSSASTSA